MPQNNNYQRTIAVGASAADAFAAVVDVAAWWVKSIEGPSRHPGDQFKVDMGKTYVTIKITEFIPGRRLVWSVVDCYIHFLEDKREWTGTSIVFEIDGGGGSTSITMTHVGLTPEVECFEACQQGWDGYFLGSLPALITEHMGKPKDFSAAKVAS